jgi:hypothetical protein
MLSMSWMCLLAVCRDLQALTAAAATAAAAAAGLFTGSLNVECVTDNLASGPGGVWSTTTAGTECRAVSSGRKLI